jgi:hypothetical protein
MSNLTEIAPSKKPRLMDLVETAGMDASDWGNFKGGKNNATMANPCRKLGCNEAKACPTNLLTNVRGTAGHKK